MSFKIIGYVCFALIIQSVHGQPDRCYFCNTEVHGQGCNDPIESDQIQVQSCSDLEIVTAQTSYFSEVRNFFTHHGISPQKTDVSVKNTEFPDVCIYMTYEFNLRNVSARGCESEQRSTTVGVLDICEYYRQIIPTARITNFNCSVCTENLCNHRGSSQTVQISLKLIAATLLMKLFFI